jgi:hypothetical protein
MAEFSIQVQDEALDPERRTRGTAPPTTTGGVSNDEDAEDYEVRLSDMPSSTREQQRDVRRRRRPGGRSGGNDKDYDKKDHGVTNEELEHVCGEPSKRKPKIKAGRRRQGAHRNPGGNSEDFYDLDIDRGCDVSLSDISMPSMDDCESFDEDTNRKGDDQNEPSHFHMSPDLPYASHEANSAFKTRNRPKTRRGESPGISHTTKAGTSLVIAQEYAVPSILTATKPRGSPHDFKKIRPDLLNASPSNVEKKPKARPFSQRLLMRAQSESLLGRRNWAQRQPGGHQSKDESGIEYLRCPSLSTVNLYLASSEWCGRQKAKDEWRQEFLSKERRSPPSNKKSAGPSPSLATHTSEINLRTQPALLHTEAHSVLVQSTHLNAREGNFSRRILPGTLLRVREGMF